MSRQTRTVLLLVLRDISYLQHALASIRAIWSLREKDASSNASQKEILGVLVETSLMIPTRFKIIHSFGVSGIWSFCELHCTDEDADRSVIIQSTIHDVLEYNKADKKECMFYPVFNDDVSHNSIRHALETIKTEYHDTIKHYIGLDHEANHCSLQEVI